MNYKIKSLLIAVLFLSAIFINASIVLSNPVYDTIPPNDPNIRVEGSNYLHYDDTVLTLYRHSDAVYANTGAENTFSVEKAKTASGVLVKFKTNSPTIKARFKIFEGHANPPPTFGVFQNGLLDYSQRFTYTAGSSAELEISSNFPSQEVDYMITMPNWTDVGLLNIIIEQGYSLTPISENVQPVYVSVGNSITHGKGQDATYETYPFLLNNMFNWNHYNVAVGGSKVSQPIANMLRDDFSQIDYLTLLIGYNDWRAGIDTVTYGASINNFLDSVRTSHAETKMFCITLTYNSSPDPDTVSGVASDDFRTKLENIVNQRRSEGDTNLYLIDGEAITSAANLRGEGDEVHFSISGASDFADSLYVKIAEIIGVDPPPPPQETDNLICNPGFENGLDDWINNTNGGAVDFLYETTDPYAGNLSLVASVDTAASWENRIESCEFVFQTGHTYNISFWAKTVSGVSGQIRHTLRNVDPSVTIKSEYLDINDSVWTEYSYTYLADTVYSTAYLRISFMDVVDYLIDEVNITDISIIDCNGDLNGLAYIDNCDTCVGGNTGVESDCKTTGFTGSSRVLSEPFFGLNTKSIGADGNSNFLNDINLMEAWKKLRAKIYRYPGGTFGNSFDWETGTTIIDGRPPSVDPPVRPADLVKALPEDTEILWMANIRVPLPSTGYDWTKLTEEELLSQEVLEAKTQNILDGLAAFRAAGKDVKYIELGNEMYFNEDESAGEAHGPGGDGGDYQGDHFPYGGVPAIYVNQMAYIAKAIKQAYPDIEISLTAVKDDSGIDDWNPVIIDSLAGNPQLNDDIAATDPHWYQNERWYDNQEILPQISDEATTKTAFGFAFDYIDYKYENELNGEVAPLDKEIWVTEGDILDPSDTDTWVEGLRDAILFSHYVLMDQVTMYTPQIFAGGYIEKNLKLTAKGKASSMVMAAAEDMTLVEELALGGAFFEGDYGGPYPELTGIKCSNSGSNERLILINCSENTYADLNVNTLVSIDGLHLYQRYSTAPWASDIPTEEISEFTNNTITLQPYSITIICEKQIIDELIEYDLIVRNPTGTYPDNYIKIFDFGSDHITGEKIIQVLEIKNDGDTTVLLANPTLALSKGTHFEITQPDSLMLEPGASSAFKVIFSPDSVAAFSDRLTVFVDNGVELSLFLHGSASKNLSDINNLLLNGDFELGVDAGWTASEYSNATATLEASDSLNTYNGLITANFIVTNDTSTAKSSDARLTTALYSIPEEMDELKLSMFAKSIEGSGSFFIFPFFYDSLGTKIDGSYNSSSLYPTNYFSKFAHSCIVPAGAVSFQIEFRTGDAENYYFDDVLVDGPESNIQEPNVGDFIITEINSHENANASWMEIQNVSGMKLNLENVEVEHYKVDAEPSSTISLSGILDSAAFVIITRNIDTFFTVYGIDADFQSGGFSFNGNTDGFRVTHEIYGAIDQFNNVPLADQSMTNKALYLRKEYYADGSDLENHWCEIIEQKNGTPGAPNVVSWQTTGTDEWHTDANWDDSYAPCECSDVLIPSGVIQPIISQSGAMSKNIEVSTGALLTLNPMGELSMFGGLTSPATDTAVIMQSDQTSSSSLIVNERNTSSGIIKYERYLRNDVWHLAASPVVGETYDDDFFYANFIDHNPDSTAFALLDYDTGTNLWNPFPGRSSSGDFDSGQGYLIARFETGTEGGLVSFVGELADSDTSFAVSTSGLRWNAVGNPFTSAIGINASTGTDNFIDTNAVAGLDPSFVAIYYWNDTLNNVGDYVEVNHSTPAFYAPPGQGFFIQAQSGASQIEFPMMLQSHQTAAALKSAIIERTELKLTASTATNSSSSAQVKFIDNMTKGLDVGYDAGKFKGNADLNLYTQLVEDNGVDFGIQCLPNVGLSAVEIPLGLDLTDPGVTTFSIDKSGFSGNLVPVLEDKLLNTKTAFVNENDVYSVNISSSGYGRFYLSFSSLTEVSTFESATTKYKVWYANNFIQVSGNYQSGAMVSVYDVNGRLLKQQILSDMQVNMLETGFAKSGMYLVRITTNNHNSEVHKVPIVK